MSWFSNMLLSNDRVLNYYNYSREPFIYNLGDPRTSTALPANQDYNTIKKECLSSGRLFEDPVFSPPVAGAKSKGESCEWVRPKQIVDDPKFISDGVSRFDAVQGGVGDCWLVSSASILASNRRLFTRVVPHDQTFDGQDYCGIFRFRFWQYGKWIEVIIDDRLPIRDGELLFMRSGDANEFWSPLLEKAYAKIHGSYAALVGGTTSEALVDFTGGITEYHDLKGPERPQNIFLVIKKAHERNSLMGASIEAKSEADREAELDNGLVKGHAYSITSVTELSLGGRSVKMLRLRNPWSGTSEWKGRWSDKSPEWSMINEYERRKIGLTFEADGEFWMSCDDFEENFTRVEVCHLNPDSLDDDKQQRKWHTHMFEGVWIQGISAGGCRNNIETYATNPQYVVTLSDYEGSGSCEIIVSLMQKHRRSKYLMGSDSLTIGFAIYAIPDGIMDKSPIGSSTPRYYQQVLTTEFFHYNKSVARTPTYINLREVTNRFSLKPGKYCIIPSTYEANEGDSEFILRVWTEAPMSAAEMDVKPGVYPPYPSGAHLTPGGPAQPKALNGGGTGTPVYPAYPGAPATPSAHPSAPSYPTYPSLPDEPTVPNIVVPKPQPGPNSFYPEIEINADQVYGIITGLAGFLSTCLGNLSKQSSSGGGNNYGGIIRRNVGDNYAEARHVGRVNNEPKLATANMSPDQNVNNDEENNRQINGEADTVDVSAPSSLFNGNNTNFNNGAIEHQVVNQLVKVGKVDADQYFHKIAGVDGLLDANELQSVLNAAMKKELGYNSFSVNTCRALIAAVDDELIGKLGKVQFELLWADIMKWTRAFKTHDKDNNFAIDASELRAALNEAGIIASRKLLIAITQRYGNMEKIKQNSKNSVGPKTIQPVRRSLSLDGFVHCCVKLMQSIKFWYEAQIGQRVKMDVDSFRERNRRAFRPESPLSISSQHMNELYDDPGPDFIRIDLDTFLLRIMYS